MYRIIPVNDRVLVRRMIETAGYEEHDDGSVTTQSGLYVPEESVERRPEYEILAFGTEMPDWFRANFDIGDKLLLGEYTGTDYNDHMLILADEILAKLIDTDKDGPGVVGYFDRIRAQKAAAVSELEDLAGGDSEPLENENGVDNEEADE